MNEEAVVPCLAAAIFSCKKTMWTSLAGPIILLCGCSISVFFRIVATCLWQSLRGSRRRGVLTNAPLCRD